MLPHALRQRHEPRAVHSDRHRSCLMSEYDITLMMCWYHHDSSSCKSHSFNFFSLVQKPSNVHPVHIGHSFGLFGATMQLGDSAIISAICSTYFSTFFIVFAPIQCLPAVMTIPWHICCCAPHVYDQLSTVRA